MHQRPPQGAGQSRRLFAAALLAAGLVRGAGAKAQTTDLWLDVDPSRTRTDDVLAVVQAFGSPEVAVRGVSVLYGNGTLLEALDVATETLRRVAPGQLPHLGARDARELGTPTPAVEAIAAMLEQRRLTIAALGPLTTIASLTRLRPDLVERIDALVIVAGRRPEMPASGAGPLGDHNTNVRLDADAVEVVLDAGIPLVLVGREAAASVTLATADLAELRSAGGTAAWLAELSRPWIELNIERADRAAFHPSDTLAVGWVSQPDLLDTVPARVRLERTDSTGRDGVPTPCLLVEAAGTAPGDVGVVYIRGLEPAFKPSLLERLRFAR